MEYPPGVDKRVIDWVRSEESGYSCRHMNCLEEARFTDYGAYCLSHYLKLPVCSVDGCHNPAIDPRSNRNKSGIIKKCWIHDRGDNYAEDEYYWVASIVERRCPVYDYE